jgi:hypothetical protein
MFRPMTKYLGERIRGYNMRHRPLVKEEKERAILNMVKAIHEKPLKVSGPHRHDDWEKGWGENLDLLNRHSHYMSPRDIVKPRYFNKHPVVRWKGDLYEAISEDYEGNMLATIQDYVFDKYFRQVHAVYEFGCGTGHNLFRVRDVNPTAKIMGLDWAESAVELINRLDIKLGFSARKFDFFNPDWDLPISAGAGVYTVAALEQVGTRFHPWLNYILEQRPAVIAHIEPIGEALNPDVLQDYLSAEYFKKRGYLSGYLDHLRLLAKRGKILLHEITRTTIGSQFIEGYTVIVWSPCL